MVKDTNLPERAAGARETIGGDDELARLKFQFLASLNHEIRTPLTGILGMTDLLLETELSAEQIEYINAARLCAENLFEILNATLEFTALSAGNLVLEQTEFYLVEMLKTVFEEHRVSGESKNLTMRLVLDPELPDFVVGDAIRIQQLLSYLISNAVKFTHFGSVTVDAGAEPDGDGGVRLVVNVIDTGIGIPRESLKTVFESFRQLESGLSRSYQGLGLGLALAQKLAAVMGGTLDAESTPGEGSRFWFTLPLRLAESPAHPVPEPRDDGYRLLVVEDNTVAQDVVRHILKRRPYTVDFVDSGEAAIEAVAANRYNLILMDLQMSGMDGFESTARVRAIPGYANVPVVAFTANSSTEFRGICREHGMQGFVGKPIRAEEMLKTLDSFLP